MGAVVVTDDRDRTERFWSTDEFVQFTSVDDLGTLASELLDDPTRLERMSGAAQSRALALHSTGLWRAIDRTLTQRGLPPVGVVDDDPA